MEDIKDDNAPWDKEDDKHLRTLVSVHGLHNWPNIATHMNSTFPGKNRTGPECKERWYAHLDPTVSKQPWTDQEELEMLIAHQKHQNKWSDVAAALKGRSNNTIKNRFYSIFRKVKNKIKRRDLTYGSKLELLEIFYMISLMEHYFKNPQPVSEQKGKRGKDFIYSLLRTLRAEDVVKYKGDLQRLGIRESSMEELWLEMANNPGAGSKIASDKNDNIDKPIDLFPYIADPPAFDRSCYELPMPHTVKQPEPLTPDEKDFIQFQAFKNKEPYSAGYLCTPMAISPPSYRQVPLSAGIIRPNSMAPRYEAFSDFTDMAMPSQPRPQFMQNGQIFVNSPGTGMSQVQTGCMPQIRFPVQYFRPSPM